MKLASKNILLRALEPEDIDFLFATENSVDLWEVSSTQTPFSKHILKQYIANAHQDIYTAKQLRWVIDHKKTPIGMIDLFDFDPLHQRAGVGIVITKPYQKKGFASEALTLFIEHAFSILHLHQIYANITADNKGSISLFTKHGFKKVGVKREWHKTQNGFKDEILFQLINS